MRTFTTTEKRDRPKIDFEVDGRQMTFTVPGYAPLLSLAEQADDPNKGVQAMRGILDYLGSGLSDEDGDWLLGRLNDPADGFDLTDALAIVEGLMEEVAARPTTPSSDSSASQNPTPSTGGRHLVESTPQPSTSDEPATSLTTT